jgi:hypothetical protein
VGFDSAPRKIIVAGPHGDERNAQRVIMKTQKYFITNEPPADTALYFIPCLSPTMCFADARGIPNRFWKGGEKDGSVLQNGPFELNGSLSIPELHDNMKYEQRNELQRQRNQINPDVGVDANRDYHLSLPSSQAFMRFITAIKPNTTNDINVFMIHGYAGYNEKRPGDVYGPYTIETKDGKKYAYMAKTIKNYVLYILDSLFDKEYTSNATNSTDGGFFYMDKNLIPEQCAGEWSRHLYGEDGGKGILSFDIELPQSYNEGVNGAPGGDGRDKAYNPNDVESAVLPFFKNNAGKIVGDNVTTIGLYEVLKNYFADRGKPRE